MLTRALIEKGVKVRILTRKKGVFSTNTKENLVTYVQWNPEAGPPPSHALDGAYAVIHLAGETIAGRWTTAKKKAIRESRILSTRHLVDGVLQMKRKPSVVLFTSAIGFYGHRDEDWIDEKTKVGTGFLSEICEAWEFEAKRLTDCRTAILRLGLVLSAQGGALGAMMPAFRFGLGASLGSGRQWMSWIHIEDLVRMYLFILETKDMSGVFNAVSPNPIQNSLFSKQLGKHLKRPVLFKIPVWVMTLLLGEASQLVLASQRVRPARIQSANFQFNFETIEAAFDQIVAES